jgi:hypothetical protein
MCLLALGIERFFADAANMWGVLIHGHGFMPARMVIPFV